MPHQDQDGHTATAFNHQALKQALLWLLPPAVLSHVKFRKDSTWTPHAFAMTAILWAWSDERTLTDRFSIARKITLRMLGLSKRVATSYQAFVKMLRTWTDLLTATLTIAFRERLPEQLPKRYRVHGFVTFAVDGSRMELARTVSNEMQYSPPAAEPSQRGRRPRGKAARQKLAREKKRNSPQMWLTVMWHVGTGLPWDWRTGPSNSSERDHWQQMLAALPTGALVTADAGYVGYEHWKAVLDGKRHLLIRVGANVRLLKKLGYVREKRGLVYLWPDRASSRDLPPLVLRLVVVREARHPMYLVTSVRDEKRLSDEQVRDLYFRRWGIELFFRHFKQSFERRKLRSHAADNARVEAVWSLLGLWAMALHAQVELAKQGVPASRISVANVLRAYRTPMREYKSRPDPGESLGELLSVALIDDYERLSKASRDYPRKKHGHAIGVPQILSATPEQIQIAREIKHEYKKGLAA